jgi:hypothetical protein
MNEATAAATLAAYLETLSNFTPQIVDAACRAFCRRATRFAPNAGEIYERCAELADKAAKEQRLRLASQNPVRSEKTPEERARVQAKYQSTMASLLSNNGPEAFKANPKQNPVTERRVAQQWLERHGAGSHHEVKTKINVSPELEAYLQRAFPQKVQAAE